MRARVVFFACRSHTRTLTRKVCARVPLTDRHPCGDDARPVRLRRVVARHGVDGNGAAGIRSGDHQLGDALLYQHHTGRPHRVPHILRVVAEQHAHLVATHDSSGPLQPGMSVCMCVCRCCCSVSLVHATSPSPHAHNTLRCWRTLPLSPR